MRFLNRTSIEDGAVGGLEEDVGEGVAWGYFGLDLFLEIVGGVFGGSEGLLVGALELVLLDEMPTVGGGAFFEEVGEGGAGVAFGVIAVKVELGEGVEVGFDGLVGGL
jgi:hypothetical protein